MTDINEFFPTSISIYSERHGLAWNGFFLNHWEKLRLFAK